ncbi:MAG: serine dehydratase subunit alpha family protein [Clostridia bacterium]|nr:serine dehydratase subunit alpha family protein [Clostridia bacterium]
MLREDPRYSAYVSLLRQELVPAMGCTEPIAVAYAAARARALLGCLPDSVLVGCSGSIIKNVKSVIVPNTGGLKGLEAAAAAGIVAGDADRKLEVISGVTREQFPAIRDYLSRADIRVEHLIGDRVFEILITVRGEGHSATVRITDTHTHITLLEKDGQVQFESPSAVPGKEISPERLLLNVADIYDFAKTLEISDVEEVLSRQIAYNMAIAEEGLRNPYGANVGKTLLRFGGGSAAPVETRARAWAAAGSDARMHGCSLPVVINSGSGNQGITVSVPIIIYAREIQAGEDLLYRSLALANLIAIQQKTYIGTLSAFCGAVCAGVGAGAGIAFLLGEDLKTVAHTVANALAILPGMVCDGAKPSCAAKISQAVEAGIFGYQMYKNGQQFYAGDGMVVKGVDANVEVVGRLGREGMRETNREIIAMMLGEI